MKKFGVFVRSVGERTEDLCRESVVREIDEQYVHIIRNLTPAWRAYDEMFRIALERNYDWYLGLDADVVLRQGWLDVMQGKVASLDRDRVYDISFPMLDAFGGVVDKGNHVFNGKCTREAQRILHQHTKESIKPESGIFSHLKDKDSFYFQTLQPLGWHGFEQYYRDVYYRFYMLGARGKKLAAVPQSKDAEVAKLGWEAGHAAYQKQWLRRLVKSWRGPTPDASIREKFDVGALGIQEKGVLTIRLEEFWNRYKADVERLTRPEYDMNRGVEKIWKQPK